MLTSTWNRLVQFVSRFPVFLSRVPALAIDRLATATFATRKSRPQRPPPVTVTPAEFTGLMELTLNKVAGYCDDVQMCPCSEKFVRGSGSGGQAMQKASNCVILTHRATGISVRCHRTRSLESNRAIARRLMAIRLDERLRGPASYAAAKACVRVPADALSPHAILAAPRTSAGTASAAAARGSTKRRGRGTRP